MQPDRLSELLSGRDPVMRVELTRVRGSSPREAGAFMLVSAEAVAGTIGGGQLEYMAIDKARALLRTGAPAGHMDVPLGPEIGQCCGGRVEITLTQLDDAGRAQERAEAARQHAALPHVYVLGAGHVGRALADLFQHMPVRCILVDSRAEELSLSAARVEQRLSVLPEADVRAAPAGSAFIVLTHDHALDFLLTAEALGRRDAAYVGMIGSATKRASFERYCRTQDGNPSTDTLTCPIGASGSRDKRPAMIAAVVAAEVITALTSETTAERPERATS